MKVGDLVKWSWYLEHGEERTSFLGVIVADQVHPDYQIRIFSVLDTDGDIVSIRADDGTLEAV